MLKENIIIGLVMLGLLAGLGIALAADAPHNPSENVNCDSCHIAHAQLGNSQGASLTKDTNENLCLGCHNLFGAAEKWPLDVSDQAIPGASGISHRWDRSMTANTLPLNLKPGTDPDSVNNAYGLRAAGYCSVSSCADQISCTTATPNGCGGTWYSAELKNASLKNQMKKYGNIIVCSVCHMQHSQSAAPYDPYSANALSGDSGTIGLITNSNLTLTDRDSTKNWGNYAGYYVVMTSGASINLTRMIQSNTANTLTLSSAFPSTLQVVVGDTYYITKTGSSTDSGTVASVDSNFPTSKFAVNATAAWTSNQWSGYFVKMKSGLNNGLRRRIISNDVNKNLVTEAFPFNVSAANGGDTYYITSNRHFMRINNAMSDMCNDCHYYRSPASVPQPKSGGSTSSQTDVRTWDGNKKSHPTGKNLMQRDAALNPDGVQDATQFNGSAFLEPAAATWAAQSGSRGEVNGGSDANITNNVTTSVGSKITCLSCHNMHYADSDSSTVDAPSGYAP